MDGGGVTAPRWGIWFPNGRWDVENHGVAPDIEVEFDPKASAPGRTRNWRRRSRSCWRS